MSITKLFLNYFNCVQEKSFFTVEFDFMSHLKVRLNKKMNEKILPSAVLNHQGFLFLSDRVLFRVQEKKEKDKQEHSMGKLSQQKLCFTVYLVVLICIICTAGDMAKQQFYGPCFANGCFVQTKVTIFTVLQFKFTSEYYTFKKKKSSIPYFFDFQILSQENGWKFRKTFGQSFYCQELPDYKVVWDNRSLGEL